MSTSSQMHILEKGLLTIFLAAISLLSTNATADNAIDISNEKKEIIQFITYYEDKTAKTTVDKILGLPENAFSKSIHRESLNFGYTRSAFWLRLNLTNNSELTATRLLNIGYAILDSIDIYFVSLGKITNHIKTGDKYLQKERPFDHPSFVFPLNIKAGQNLTLLIRVQSSSSLQVPLQLWTYDDLSNFDVEHYLGVGIYFGCLLAMFFYHIFLGLTLKESRHLFYSGYVFSSLLLIGALEGINYYVLWPYWTGWNQISVVFAMGCIYFFGGLFTLDFLSLRETRWRSKAAHIFVGFSFIVIICSLILPYYLSIKLAFVNTFFGLAIAIWFGISRSIEGDIPARYFTFAFFSIVVGGILLTANKVGLIPRTIFTEHALTVGSAIQVILLSLAMADRLTREKQQRIAAQSSLLRQERELIESQQLALINERKANQAQKSSLLLQQRTNEILERKVEKRTKELEEANERLKEIAITDSLTGVKNRKFLDEIFHTECKRAQRHQTDLSVIMLDIDHFKSINDEYGHVIGDRCLMAVARQLKKSSSRASDVIARYGGEEFCIVLPNTPRNDAVKVAENLCKNIASMNVQVNDYIVKMTISIGVACIKPATVADAFRLIDQADKALYRSKKNGRNQVTLSTECKQGIDT